MDDRSDHHTALMDALHSDLMRQFPGSITEEDGNSFIIIETPRPFLTVDVSSLAAAIFGQSAMLSAAPAPEDPAGAGAWIKRALRFIDLCDADAADYHDREMHEDAADLTREGFALFDMGDDACIADLKHASLRAQREEEQSGLTCQKCGGEIAGWLCQQCPAEFRENDAGALVFDEETVPPTTSRPKVDAETMREALKHYACSCEPGHCAMSADDTDVPVDDHMCGRRAAEALALQQEVPGETTVRMIEAQP